MVMEKQRREANQRHIPSTNDAPSAPDASVSVIVPVYNAAAFLRDALDSLQNQSHNDFEAILIDDGSTDDSLSICRAYAESDNRFKIISQANRGVSAARNAGVDAAKGSWIAFLDADDIMRPDALATLLDAAASTGADISVGNYSQGVTPGAPKGNGAVSHLNPLEAIGQGLYQKRIFNNPWGTLFRARLLKGDGSPRFRPGRYEDLDFFYRVFENARLIAYCDLDVYFYRDNPGSFINRWSEERLDVLDVTDRIVDHYSARLAADPSDQSRMLLKAALDRRFSAHFNMLALILRNRDPHPEAEQRCLKVIRENRMAELRDPETRLKNKLGALASFGGTRLIALLARLIY